MGGCGFAGGVGHGGSFPGKHLWPVLVGARLIFGNCLMDSGGKWRLMWYGKYIRYRRRITWGIYGNLWKEA